MINQNERDIMHGNIQVTMYEIYVYIYIYILIISKKKKMFFKQKFQHSDFILLFLFSPY